MRRAKMQESSLHSATEADKAGNSSGRSPGILNYVTRILATTVLIFVVVFVGLRVVPEPSPKITTLLGKALYTLRWQVFSFFTFSLCITLVAFTRLFTPALNPLSSRGLPYVDAYVRCLQNTLEQLVLSVPAQLILSGYLESEQLRIIPILVVLFVIGRIAFWIGYPLQRTYGFVLTFVPTAMTYVVDLYFFLTVGPAFRLE